MGQSKGGGYEKMDILAPNQKALIDQMLSQVGPYMNQAAQTYQGFLPGGKGAEAITNQAQQNFQQQTIPSIMNAFGSGAKSSSALNQALAAGGANLNTDIASMLAQMQMGAAQGLGGLGAQAGQFGMQPQFALQQRQMPFWQQMLLGGIGAGGQIGGGYLGRPSFK